MNLIQLRHTGSLKAYVRDFNTQMNVTPKIDKFAKKCIFLGGLQKWVADALFKFPKLSEDVAGSIKIVEKIMTLHVTLKYGTLEFVKSFTLCKIDEVNIILEDIFF